MHPELSRRAACAALAGVLATCRLSRAADTTVLRPDDPRLTIEGRTAFASDGALRIGFPGVALRFAADASHVTMRLRAMGDANFVAVLIDDAPQRVVSLHPGAQEIVLYDGPPGRHRVEVVRRSESWEGTMEVVGFTVAGDVSALPLPQRRLMFIGDSITCGAALDVARDSREDGPQIGDASRAFGRLLAHRLGAACHLVSYGGRGLMRDWQNIRAINNAPVFYERAMPDDPAARWNHARYVPDAIGVCLGTNDFNQGVPDQNEFVNAYVEFAEKLLRDAPGAQLFLIDSPMTDDTPEKGHRRTLLGDYLDETVAQLARPQVRRARLRHYAGRPSNPHPIYEDHVAIAGELEPTFRGALGWT